MPTPSDLENRLTVLEAAVADIQRQLRDLSASQDANWVDRVSGSFTDDPVFAEILAEGRKWRESFSPVEEKPCVQVLGFAKYCRN
jgi:hypothetical protein